MAGLHNLPQELQDQILDYFERVDFLAIARTAKFMHELVVPRLYRKISMSGHDRILLLQRTVGSNKEIASLVAHLELHWEPMESRPAATLAIRLCSFLPRLPNLIHLTISKALGDTYWIYEHLNLPSLREFRSFTLVHAQFLQRHPKLREVTIMGLDNYRKAVPLASLAKLRILRILASDPVQLFNICSNGQDRPTLRRIDWARSPKPPALTPGVPPPQSQALKYESLHRVAASVTQVNYLNGYQSLSPPLNPPWASVRRVGIRVTHSDQWPCNLRRSPNLELSDCAMSFPNMETLDVVLERNSWFEGKDEDILEMWEQMQEGLLCFPGLKRVTLYGRNWTRPTTAAAFVESACDPNDIPDLSVEFKPTKP